MIHLLFLLTFRTDFSDLRYWQENPIFSFKFFFMLPLVKKRDRSFYFRHLSKLPTHNVKLERWSLIFSTSEHNALLIFFSRDF